MNINYELIIIFAGFLGTIFAVVWKFSKMQSEQSNGIKKNAEAIGDNRTEIAKLQSRTSACDLHQAAIAQAKENINVIEHKISTQSAFNIQTEKKVDILVAEFEFIKTGMNEMRADIKELLRRKLEEK